MSPKQAQILIGVIGELTGLIRGALAGSFKLINNLLTMGFGMALKYNQEAVAFSREVGLNAKQAQAYTEVLTTRARDLGAKYGIAADAVAQLEKNLARATGRVLMLTNAETERMVQINKLVGQETFNKFAEEMFSMGAQISTMQGAVSKAYATAARSGLNASKASEKVAQNLGMANRLAFKNGIDGLTRMVMLSEKFGLNMQTIESVANKFMDLQEGIETSANLTMLGGAIGAYGGNPLDMSYEALADPEALAKRLTHMLAGHAQFNAETGVANVSFAGMEYIRAMSKTLGVSVDELTKSTKKISEVNYKNAHFMTDINKLATDKHGNIDEQLKDFILNRSQIKNGKLYITDSNAKEQEINHYINSEAGRQEFAKMAEYSKLSDDEIMRKGAESLISINELITGWMNALSGTMAKEVANYIPKIAGFLGDLFKIIQPHIGKIADNIKQLLATAFTEENLKKIKSAADGIIKFLMWLPEFLTSSWKALLGGAALAGILGILGWGLRTWNDIKLLLATRGAGTPGAGGTGTSGAGASPTTWWGKNVANAKAAQAGKTGLWSKGLAGAKGLGSVGKIGAGLGIASGIGIGAINWMEAGDKYDKLAAEIEENNEISRAEKDRRLRKAEKDRSKDRYEAVGKGIGTAAGSIIGGIIGSFFGPGVGTFVGGTLGAAAGDFIGGAVGSGVNWLVNGSDEEEGYAEGGPIATGKISGVKYNGDRARVSVPVNSGEYVVNDEQFRKLFYMVDNINTMIMEKTNITQKPYDGKTIIYTPANANMSTVGNNTITVNDINVKFSGTVRLEGGGHYRDIDWKEITKDPAVMSYFVNALRTAFSSGSYVKPNHDTAFMSYNPSNATIIGQMKNTFQA